MRQRVYRLLARSRAASRAALLLRNQADGVLRAYLDEGFTPEGVFRVLDHLAPSMHRFVDVGANAGTWTEALLVRTPSARGLLIEPAPSAVLHLRDRLGDRADILHAAASDTEHAEVLFFDAGPGQETSSLLTTHAGTTAHSLHVRQITLDAETARRGWKRLDLVKIDAEGYDLHVIRGMRDLLGRQAVGAVQFEYNAPWAEAGSTLAAARALLTSCGYALYLIRRDGLYTLDARRYGEYFSYSNYLAVAPETDVSPLLRGVL